MKRTFLVYALLSFTMLLKAQWEFINPNPPQATYKSVVHIAENKYAATGATAIMLTSNSGEDWQPAVLEGTYYFNCVFFVDEETGYAGGYDGALLKTTDGGNSWETLNCGIDDELNAIYFVNRDTGYIAAQYGAVLKTTDGGANWVKKTVSGEYHDLLTIKFFNASTGYASGKNGTFWKTTDGGENWTVSDLNFWDVYDLSLLNESTLIAASDDGIYKSSDGGTNWNLTFRPSTTPRDYVIYRLDFVNENTGYATGRLNEIYKTTDGGDNWSVISLPAEYELDGYFPGIAFESADKGVIGDNSCFYSVDVNTNTWKQFKKSLTSNNFEAVAFSNDTTVFAAGYNIIARSVTNGRTWVEIEDSNIAGTFYDILFTNNSTGYAVGLNSSLSGDNKGVILKTDNGGDSWNMVHNPPARLSGIHFPTSDVGYAAGLSSQMVKTTDGGTTWTSANTGIDADLLSVFFTSSNNGYACGATGKIYKTTDGGNTWTLQASGVTYSLHDILFINDSAGFAVGGGKTILGTTNGGNTWNELIPSGTRPILTLYSICFTTPDEGIIVGEKGILYVTTDGGKTWELSNLPYYGYVTGIASGNPYTTIAVGWYGSVFRKYTGPEESPLDENNNVVSTNFIDDNAWPFTIFPNPATTHFHIKSESEVTGLEIYTLTGSLVSKIQGSVYGAVSTSGIAKGVYILVIHKNNKSYSQKLIIK